MTETSTHISRALRAAREAKGLRQSELARMVGIDSGHLSRIESGKLNPKVTTLTELARALDLEIMLIPRKQVPIAKAMIKNAEGQKQTVPAYRLGGENEDE